MSANPQYMKEEMPDEMEAAEANPCGGAGDPRDPNYDPRHDIICYGEAPDGTCGYKCRRRGCTLDYID